MSSVNKVILVGNLGQDPDVKTMSSGDKVVNLSIATSESRKDKSTGEKKERTEWHKVVVFNSNLVNVCENYLKKGSKIYIEGQLETRSWEQDGVKKYTTEVILRPYKSIIAMLDSKNTIQQSEHDQSKANGYQPQPHDYFEDEIPF